jgi:hypothetical protein
VGFLTRRPLWREDGLVTYLYNCFWALPEQWLSNPNPAKFTIILYHLICDSPNLKGQFPVFICPRNREAQLCPRALPSLFVASYDSQGYGAGILTRLKSKSHVTTDSRSVSMSRCRAHSGTCDQILLSVQRVMSESYRLVSVRCPLRREAGS